MSTATLTTPIHEMCAAEMAAAIRDGVVTPLEVAGALLERIAQYDGAIKSFSHLDRESVLIEAEALTNEAKEGKFRGPFHGVPFGVKEQFTVEGVPTLDDWSDPNPPIATYDATVVAKLREAGALLLGKLYMVGPAGVPPTRNPFNVEYSPGGSSSGSGASVGARFVPFSMAEQTGGSGIRPAAYNGVSGLKPTYGRNSRRGMIQMAWSHDHACIIATTIRDVAKVFAITGGYDPADPTTVYGHEPALEAELAKPPRIGVVRNFFPDLTTAPMQACIDASAQKLAAAGADVVDFYFPEVFGGVWPSWMLVGGAEGSTINAKGDVLRAENGMAVSQPGSVGELPPASKFANLPRKLGTLIPATYYLQAQRTRRFFRELANESMAGFDAILMATAPGEPPRSRTSSGDWSLLTPWSHTGCPAISIPGGLGPNGLPLGLQLVGPALSDEHLLATGAWCQDVLGTLPAPAL